MKRHISYEETLFPDLLPSASSQNQSGVKNREFSSIMAKVHSGQDQAAKEMPGYGRCRWELDRSLDEKSTRMKREAPPETRALSRNSVQGISSYCVPRNPLLILILLTDQFKPHLTGLYISTHALYD